MKKKILNINHYFLIFFSAIISLIEGGAYLVTQNLLEAYRRAALVGGNTLLSIIQTDFNSLCVFVL